MKFENNRNLIFTSFASIPFSPNLACHELVTEYKAIIIRTSELSGVTSFDSSNPSTNDATLIIPTDKLSTEYLVSSTEGVHVGTLHASQFAVGSLHHNSNLIVTFNIKNNEPIIIEGRAYHSGDVFKKTFGELETLQFSHERDLTGTYITSNKPVAVFSGNRCQDVSGTYCSHMVSQLPPINQFDHKYIIPSFYKNTATFIQVLSPFNNNVSISTENNITRLHLREKEHRNINVTTNGVTIVKSDRPVMVTGYSFSNGPYMTVIPGINQYLDYYKVVIPNDYSDNYLCVIIPTGSINNLHINQLPIDTFNSVYQWSTVLSGKSFSVRTIRVLKDAYTLQTTNQEPFGLIVYGYRDHDGYGFAGNFVLP